MVYCAEPCCYVSSAKTKIVQTRRKNKIVFFYLSPSLLLWCVLHLNTEVNVQRFPSVGKVTPEVLVQVFANPDVLEHPLQLARVLEPTRLL